VFKPRPGNGPKTKTYDAPKASKASRRVLLRDLLNQSSLGSPNRIARKGNSLPSKAPGLSERLNKPLRKRSEPRLKQEPRPFRSCQASERNLAISEGEASDVSEHTQAARNPHSIGLSGYPAPLSPGEKGFERSRKTPNRRSPNATSEGERKQPPEAALKSPRRPESQPSEAVEQAVGRGE